MAQYRVNLARVLAAGIDVNVDYGISDEERKELAESESLLLVITESGNVGLYHEPCANCEELMPALNGVSAGGFLRRDDVRAVTLKRLIAPLKCPKCGAENCTLDGGTIRKGGEIPACRCKGCGYRGPAEKF